MRRLLLVLLLLAGCATAPDGDGDAADAPRFRYSGDVGESPVGVIPDVTLRDEARAKDLVVTIEYPTRGGPHPLIVFSHGFGGSNRAYVGLSSYWASQGYVVIRPAHADSGRIREFAGVDDVWETQTPADWAARVRDVTFVLDSVERLEQEFPELKGKIDPSRVGVGGHSYGAHTAMLAGGVRTYPGAVRYADPRVKAIVAMSPQGPADDRGLTTESWAELRVPVLFMTGSNDRGITEAETPEWRRQAFELSPAGEKWFVSIEGARHGSFAGRGGALMDRRIDETDFPGGTERERAARAEGQRIQAQGVMQRQREILSTIRTISLAFWDAQLRGDAEGREALDKAGERSGVTLEKK